ncbi:hypothetical protein F5X97DRAFT_263829 [Nemania serpens]|nr:hypothetical protein F5X97DRAFT_263829 [Nemania serpens]
MIDWLELSVFTIATTLFLFLRATLHGLLYSALETLTTLAYAAPAGLVASILVKRTKRFEYLIVIERAFLLAVVTSKVTMHPDSSKAVPYAPPVVGSIGADALFPAPLFAV